MLAYKWLLLAEQANQAFSDASRRARKKLATELLSVQVTEAERMVSQWTGGSENPSWARDVANVASAKAASGVV